MKITVSADPFLDESDLPLVSVVALAYNSRKYILDTLESIRLQTYPNIELIVTDDGSTDGTAEFVMEWLEQHGSSFHSARIITARSNEGICANVSKGLESATGKWLKLIACDDALAEYAVTEFLSTVTAHRTELAFSNMATFVTSPSECDHAPALFCDDIEMSAVMANVVQLKRAMITRNVLPAPGAFFSKRLFDAAGGIDMRFRHLDDWPLWMRALPFVNKVSWISKPLVKYRLSPSAVSQGSTSEAINAFLFDDLQRFRIYYQAPRLNLVGNWDALIRSTRDRLTLRHLGNSPHAHKVLSSLLALSPLTYMKLARRLTKNHRSRTR